MGGYRFTMFVHGKELGEAVRAAAEQDRWDYGNDPYTGSIGQKSGAVEFSVKRMPRGKKITPKPFNYLEADHPSQPKPYIRSGARVLADLIEMAAYDEKACKKLSDFMDEREVERLIEVSDDKWGGVAAVPVTGSALVQEKKRLGIDGTHQKVWIVAGTAAS
jgi:hypothetical protein